MNLSIRSLLTTILFGLSLSFTPLYNTGTEQPETERNLKEFFSDVADEAKELAQEAAEKTEEVLETLGEAVEELFESMIEKAEGFFEEAPAPAKTWCIVGGTRGIGYALAQNLCADASVNCTLFVRDAGKTAPLFETVEVQPTFVEGDVATDLEALIEATKDADYIVVAQLFPYSVWQECFQQMILNCIAAAKHNKSTLVYYSKIIRYGLVSPITEASVAAPCCVQGTILNDMEKLIADAGINSIIITHPYLFGPNIGDGLLEETFTNLAKKPKKTKFKWIANDTTPFQFAYAPDLASFTRLFASTVAAHAASETGSCSRINFAGHTFANVAEFGTAYFALAQAQYKLDAHSKSGLKVASTFVVEAKRALDAYYSFETELLLDSTYQQVVCPFEQTPLATALQETYNAYLNK